MDLRERAEKWLRDNDWDYQKYGDRRGDRSAYDTLMNYEISDHLAQAYEAGFREACRLAAEICEYERGEYEKSMHDFDARGDVRMGTNEARCAVTAELLAKAIRALAEDSK